MISNTFFALIVPTLWLAVVTFISTIFAATFDSVYRFLAANATIIPPSITAVGVTWAIFYPIAKGAREKRIDRRITERSVGLYLDVLAAKVDEITSNERRRSAAAHAMREKYPDTGSLYYLDHELEFTDLRLPYVNKGQYEKENKDNHDIIERIYVEARSLRPAQKDAISSFIQHYKRSSQMESVPSYVGYRTCLAEAAMHFPDSTSLKTRESN